MKFFALIAMVFSLVSHASAADAFIGTWVYNPEKSMDLCTGTCNPKSLPQSVVITFRPTDSEIEMVSKFMGQNGVFTTVRYAFLYDGKDYPTTGTPANPVWNTISTVKISERVVEATSKIKGKKYSVAHRTVSENGMTLRVSMTIFYDDGETEYFTITTIYDRAKPEASSPRP
jgi:hypothetical protein